MVESWDSFFVAETAAAAALLGLLFVAMSINIKQFIEAGGLTDRAFGALVLLLSLLIIGLLLAMPDQPVLIMGAETVVISAGTAAVAVVSGIRGLQAADNLYRRNFSQNIIGNVIAIAPITIGGLLMIGGGEAGFYWVAAGMCLSLVKAVSEGWIFLVEINR